MDRGHIERQTSGFVLAVCERQRYRPLTANIHAPRLGLGLLTVVTADNVFSLGGRQNLVGAAGFCSLRIAILPVRETLLLIVRRDTLNELALFLKIYPSL